MNAKTLDIWEEALGKLTGVNDNYFVITLEFTTVWNIEVPRMSNDLVKDLKQMIGKDIAILRTDISGKEILMHEIKIEKKGGETNE